MAGKATCCSPASVGPNRTRVELVPVVGLELNPIPEVETTKYTNYTKGTGCKHTRACTKSAAAIGGYQASIFV